MAGGTSKTVKTSQVAGRGGENNLKEVGPKLSIFDFYAVKDLRKELMKQRPNITLDEVKSIYLASKGGSKESK